VKAATPSLSRFCTLLPLLQPDFLPYYFSLVNPSVSLYVSLSRSPSRSSTSPLKSSSPRSPRLWAATAPSSSSRLVSSCTSLRAAPVAWVSSTPSWACLVWERSLSSSVLAWLVFEITIYTFCLLFTIYVWCGDGERWRCLTT
jgi:hypothetical protein